MPIDPNRVRDIFLAALERSPEVRPGFVAEACGGDAELRAEVDRLLVAHADPDSNLEPASATTADATGVFAADDTGNVDLPGRTSAAHAFDPDAPYPMAIAAEVHRADAATLAHAGADPDATTAAASGDPAHRAARIPTDEGIGTVIAGRYTLVEVIGEGGMGSVYLASQIEPVKRQVALKLIKTGMDSRGVLARFDAERQALALMDHPNIARIYDGGLTPAGQPFFVMELVKGVPLTEYCDANRLSVQARLELFVAVCQAVQHAHQKGIIHRDLKPGNVLVTEVDGRPTPKVIDFGVAKATEVKLTDMSLADVGAIVGTPAYMSPEQADPIVDGHRHANRCLCPRGRPLRTAHRVAADRRQAVPAGGLSRDAPDGAGSGSAASQYQAEHCRSPTEHRGLPEHRARPAGEAAARGTRLGRHEGPGEGPHPALRHGQWPGPRHRTVPGRRSRRGPPAEPRLPLEEIRQAEQGPSNCGEPGLLDVGRRHRRHQSGNGVCPKGTEGGSSRAHQGGRPARTRRSRPKSEAREEAAKTQAINNFLTNDLLTQAEPANNSAEDHVTLLDVLDRAAEKVGKRFADQPELELALRDAIYKTYHGLASWEKAETQLRAKLELAQKRDAASPPRFTRTKASSLTSYITGGGRTRR